MDEHTVRVLLNEHQDVAERLAQQQAATFQVQFDALRLSYRRLQGCYRFDESVKNQFGLSKYDDPHEALSKLLQTGTVADYQREFEKLMNRVTDISEALLISFYISGLKLLLQRELMVTKPTTLGDAFGLAHVMEARLEDQGTVSGANKGTSTSGGSQYQRAVKTPLLPTPPKANVNPNAAVNSNVKPLAIKWISSTKRVEDSGEDLVAKEKEAVETGDISILNSLVGHGSPRSLQLWGEISTAGVHILIENGSTHSFVRPDVVKRMHLPLQATKVFKVYIGSGESLLCERMCSQVTLRMQGLDVEVDLYVLPMKGPDMVLGAKYTLKGEKSLCMKKISLHRMQEMLETDDVYGIYNCHEVALSDKDDCGIATLSTPSGPPELGQLLARCDTLFQIPTCLPPTREIDHRIHLLPNTKPVNGEAEIRAIKDHKERLSNAHLLSLPNFDCEFVIEADTSGDGIVNRAADALSRVFEEDKQLFASFIAFSQPLVYFVGEMRVENEALVELRDLHRRMDSRDELSGGMQLNHSTAYHPQTDGQTEVVNHCLEQYLRVMVTNRPQQWVTLAKRLSNKLAKHYYGSYKVEARVGNVAYHLVLPASSKIHPVFHVLILKAFVGSDGVEVASSYSMDGGSPKEATWEWLSDFLAAYPTYNLEDKVVFEGEWNDRPAGQGVRKSNRVPVAPLWKRDFVMG
nr:hypothetical protein [Tanacetum cinerariifolium]